MKDEIFALALECYWLKVLLQAQEARKARDVFPPECTKDDEIEVPVA